MKDKKDIEAEKSLMQLHLPKKIISHNGCWFIINNHWICFNDWWW